MKVQHLCEFYRCECIVAVKGKYKGLCGSKAIHYCNHPRNYFVDLTKEEEQTYLFRFENLNERLVRLKQEQEILDNRMIDWRLGMETLWAEMNTLKQELIKKR